MFPAGAWGLESRARCAGFSVTEIGNRKERMRDYASFPDQSPNRPPKRSKKQESGSEALPDSAKARLNRREAKKGV